MADSPTPTKPKRKRRWYQYSLRTFLLLITIFAIWLGYLSNEARKQREAVAWVKEMGGMLGYDYEVDEDGYLKQDGKPPGPKWLRETLGIDFMADVCSVALSGADVNDVTRLAGLKKLQWLRLEGAQVTDVTPLAGLRKLHRLALDGTHVSDVTPLAGLKNLRELYLWGTRVSKEQVTSLRKALPNCVIYSNFD
jgi:Leucine-rich repeat (LRR) protein